MRVIASNCQFLDNYNDCRHSQRLRRGWRRALAFGKKRRPCVFDPLARLSFSQADDPPEVTCELKKEYPRPVGAPPPSKDD